MKLDMSLKMTKLSKILLLVLLVIVLAAGGTYGYFYKFKKANQSSAGSTEKNCQMAIYTLVQNEKAKVIAYDLKNKKHFELLSIDWKDANQTFYADYSSSTNQIVYSDSNGISVYSLNDKTTTQILANVQAKNADEPDMNAKRYANPHWSKDYKKIVYNVYGYENMSWSMMDSDGKNIIPVEADGYDLAWDTSGKNYAIGSSAGMATSSGMYVNLADQFAKTKQILAAKDLKDVDSLAWTDKIYFSGMAPNNEANSDNKYQIYSINADGSNIQTLDADEYDNQDLIADTDGTLYYSKSVHQTANNTKEGIGIYSINADGSNKSLFYQDGNKNLVVQELNNDYVAIQSTTNSW